MCPQQNPSDNPLETAGAQQMAAWTLRLAQSPGFGWLLAADPHLFALLYASCAAAASPLTALEESVDAVRSLLRGDTVTAKGRYTCLNEVTLAAPPGVVPPVYVGVRGARRSDEQRNAPRGGGRFTG